MNAWLIEYADAKPSPVYVPASFAQNHGNYTLDAWAARRFETKEQAEAWMHNPDGCVVFDEPWVAREHGFDVHCCVCHASIDDFVDTGITGLCDGCIPF